MDSKNKGVNNFDVLKKMSADNMDIMLLPNATNRHAVDVKGENTYITYGAPKELGLRFLKGDKFVGGVILANETQYNEVKAKLEDTSGLKYIVLLRMNKENNWHILESPENDDARINKNYFFASHSIADAYAKDIIEFDTEANGPAVEGLNYIIVPVPFMTAELESE